MTIANIIEQAKVNTSYVAQRVLLKNRFEQNTLVAANGGLFRLSPEMLMYIKWRSELSCSHVFIDSQGIPVTLDDLNSKFSDWNALYTEMLNEYQAGLDKLKQIRNSTQLANQ